MGGDYWIVIKWWGTLFLIGAVAFPLTKKLFSSWYDRGYFFAKAVGMAAVTFLVYLAGILHIFPFTAPTVAWALAVVFVCGMALNIRNTESGSPSAPLRAGVNRGKGKHNNLLHNSLFKIQFDRAWFKRGTLLLAEEIFFFSALLFWSWVKGHEPSIQGLEKFMDFGFMKSILNAAWFPAPDMWYAGYPINYYYFGHTVVAVLTKLSGIDLTYTFNLMLAALFAFTLTMSFSIGYQLFWGKARLPAPERSDSGQGEGGREKTFFRFFTLYPLPLSAGLLTAYLVTLAGNMQTIYAFTKGYMGENPPAFWTLLWKFSELGRLGEGIERYWYANATRFIPFTIHEFPSYSFVVSDVHGHVLSLPFVLLAIALLIQMFSGLSLRGAPTTVEGDAAIPIKNSLLRRMNGFAMTRVIFYGFLCGVLLMTNASDGPIYMGLFLLLLIVHSLRFTAGKKMDWKQTGLVVGLVTLPAILTSLPFLLHFKSFVSGIAVNCPPVFLAGRKFGPLLFEGVEKCQHSPFWMMWLLWGFFISCGVWLITSKVRREEGKWHILYKEFTRTEQILAVFFVFSVVLIIFPEFFYFKDIYPAHFRSNTMFKLGYQAFILFSIVSAYTIVNIFVTRNTQYVIRKSLNISHITHLVSRSLVLIFFLPQMFLVCIYPFFSVRSYFNSLKNYQGLYGLTWLATEYPDDYNAIKYLNTESGIMNHGKNKNNQNSVFSIQNSIPVVIEADGDSYTDSARISAFTGLPAVIGWPVHEWLWRGTYDVVAPRREEVRKIYESDDMEETKRILTKYGVRYIIVGTLEREKYPDMNMNKFKLSGSPVFTSGKTTIYLVGQ
jgi:YYY domain-containing protein